MNKFFSALILGITILVSTSCKSSTPKFKFSNVYHTPYSDSGANDIYNLLFCDNISLFKTDSINKEDEIGRMILSNKYPIDKLSRISRDTSMDARFRIVANFKQLEQGISPKEKELLGLIFEIGLDEGTDALAIFKDGTCRYINYTGKMLILENQDPQLLTFIEQIFELSNSFFNSPELKITKRKPAPKMDNIRMSFACTQGLFAIEDRIEAMSQSEKYSQTVAKFQELFIYLTRKYSE